MLDDALSVYNCTLIEFPVTSVIARLLNSDVPKSTSWNQLYFEMGKSKLKVFGGNTINSILICTPRKNQDQNTFMIKLWTAYNMLNWGVGCHAIITCFSSSLRCLP